MLLMLTRRDCRFEAAIFTSRPGRSARYADASYWLFQATGGAMMRPMRWMTPATAISSQAFHTIYASWRGKCYPRYAAFADVASWVNRGHTCVDYSLAGHTDSYADLS